VTYFGRKTLSLMCHDNNILLVFSPPSLKKSITKETTTTNRPTTATTEMPSEAQRHAAQQRGRETDRLLAESLGLGVEEQQLPPPPPPNPEEFGAHFGGDDGGSGGASPPAQARGPSEVKNNAQRNQGRKCKRSHRNSFVAVAVSSILSTIVFTTGT
jgi:hypothetical protein